jgi:hypothetical protein
LVRAGGHIDLSNDAPLEASRLQLLSVPEARSERPSRGRGHAGKAFWCGHT